MQKWEDTWPVEPPRAASAADETSDYPHYSDDGALDFARGLLSALIIVLAMLGAVALIAWEA